MEKNTMTNENYFRALAALDDKDIEIKKMKKQLEIAEKALEEYARKDLWDDCYVEDFVNSHPKCAFYSNGYKIAEEALFEMKLVEKEYKK